MIKVQLWAGTIPYLRYIACHYWLVVYRDDKAERWEVWQLANQCESSWGHLHKNLMPNTAWLKGQNKWLEMEWLNDVEQAYRNRYINYSASGWFNRDSLPLVIHVCSSYSRQSFD